MRELLFRGYSKILRKWYFGSYLYLDKPVHNPNSQDPVETDPVHYIVTPDGKQHPVNPETVGQFIGLPDKTGKKIFEGDIIENRGCRWVIGFENTTFAAMDGPDMQFAMFEQYIWDHKKREWAAPDYWEVVGNIHDNPELLEVT